MASMKAAVERGAALLDEKIPGWPEHIDLATLDIAIPDLCVLGQLGGPEAGLFGGLDQVGLAVCEMPDFGFSVGVSWKDYPRLTKLWTPLIAARKEAAAREVA